MSRLHRNYLQQLRHIQASVMANCFYVSLRMFTSIPASEVFVVIVSSRILSRQSLNYFNLMVIDPCINSRIMEFADMHKELLQFRQIYHQLPSDGNVSIADDF